VKLQISWDLVIVIKWYYYHLVYFDKMILIVIRSCIFLASVLIELKHYKHLMIIDIEAWFNNCI
jgi:hypothetical protein